MEHSKENVIREKRTIEATKKNIMGPSGKIGMIVKILGNQIIRQGSGLHDCTFIDDPYEDFSGDVYENTMTGERGPLVSRDEILESSNDFATEEGYVFDGLSRGMHIEIKYWHNSNKLEVHYKGYLVYKESAGQLDAYNPFDDWENIIDRLFQSAKKKQKDVNKDKKIELTKQLEIQKNSFWADLRDKWGI